MSIDRNAVADVVAALYEEGGHEAVTIENAAAKLSISRATLYRIVSSKGDLVGVLFERSSSDLMTKARATAKIRDPQARLAKLIRLHAAAAVAMRSHMAVFFDSSELAPDVVRRWRSWRRRYESIWISAIDANMRAGLMNPDDPRVTARLLLGMLIWVSRWYRPGENITPDEIADRVLSLVGLSRVPSEA